MVSLIITTYNYVQYVERAIRSALEQSLPRSEYEILIINDASTDNTSSVIQNYQDDVRIFNLEKNIGLAAARNFGIRKSKGQFIVFLDADDYIHKDLLNIEKTFLEMNNALDAVSCDYFLVNDLGEHLEHINAEEKPIACGIMFRKDYLFHIGLYDEEFLAREEEELRIRFLEKFNIYNIILPLYRYRMHDNNLTKNDAVMHKFKNKLTAKYNPENQ